MALAENRALQAKSCCKGLASGVDRCVRAVNDLGRRGERIKNLLTKFNQGQRSR